MPSAHVLIVMSNSNKTPPKKSVTLWASQNSVVVLYWMLGQLERMQAECVQEFLEMVSQHSCESLSSRLKACAKPRPSGILGNILDSHSCPQKSQLWEPYSVSYLAAFGLDVLIVEWWRTWWIILELFLPLDVSCLYLLLTIKASVLVAWAACFLPG